MGKRYSWILLLGVVACAHHSDGGGDAGVYTSLRVLPDPVGLAVPIGGSATQDYKVFGVDAAGQHDITDQCTLSIDSPFGSFQGATLTAAPHGGETQVVGTCGTLQATAQLTVNLVGDVTVGPNTPPNAAQVFGAATLGADAARSPVIEYPIDHAVAPLNLPPIEMQWKVSGNDLFHITLTASHAAVNVYTSDPQATLSVTDWNAVAGTSVGEPLAITVEGLAQAAPATKYAGASVALSMSHDTIDTSAIYYWASSQGSIMSQTFGNTTQPAVVKDNCSGCHALSRSGSRIGYSRCVAGSCNGEWVGFLKYDGTQWNEVVNADAKQIPGTYTTFSPVGNPFPDDSQSLALVTSMSGTFSLIDPDTGAAVASNLPAVHEAGRAQTMPDWSPDGNTIVFASTPHAGQSVDVSDSSIKTMSYAFAGGAHTFGAPSPLVTAPVTLNGQAYGNLFFPSFSADGQYVVFNAARSSWRNFSDAKTAGQRIALVPAAGGAPIDLTALNGGAGDQDITWPHWAPGSTTDYYWLVFSSERDYGHEVTAGNTAPVCVSNGVKQCKQIWIAAVSKAALAAGTVDPSFAPMWLPGQDVKADNISPYWTKPAALQ